MTFIGSCPFCGASGGLVETDTGSWAARFDRDHDPSCPLRDARTRTYPTMRDAAHAWSMRYSEEIPIPKAMGEDEAENIVDAYERIRDYDRGAADVIRDVIIKAMTGR